MTHTPHRRRLDTRGRLTIPVEYRQTFEFEAGDDFDFYYENDLIIIKKAGKGAKNHEHKGT